MIPQVDLNSFTIATEVQTINEIANLEGDLVTLVTNDKTTLVAAINEVANSQASLKRTILAYSIAMS